jgi:hypothetical protein
VAGALRQINDTEIGFLKDDASEVGGDDEAISIRVSAKKLAQALKGIVVSCSLSLLGLSRRSPAWRMISCFGALNLTDHLRQSLDGNESRSLMPNTSHPAWYRRQRETGQCFREASILLRKAILILAVSERDELLEPFNFNLNGPIVCD